MTTASQLQLLSCESVKPLKPGSLESGRITVCVLKDARDDGVEHGGGTAAVEERQQPPELSGGVHGSGMDGQQSVTHVVHHGTQILRHLLGQFGMMVEKRRDVGFPVIPSDFQGNAREDVVSVAPQVVAVSIDV